jgi:hypothetical protein
VRREGLRRKRRNLVIALVALAAIAAAITLVAIYA